MHQTTSHRHGDHDHGSEAQENDSPGIGLSPTDPSAVTSNSPLAVIRGLSWTGTFGEPATITYSYNDTQITGGISDNTIRSGINNAIQAWENVANVDFQFQRSGGNVYFDRTTFDSSPNDDFAGIAFTTFQGTRILSVDVEIERQLVTFDEGSFGYLVVMHEIGHALGLKHPGDYGENEQGPFLPQEVDNLQATIMSYNDGPLVTNLGNPPETPMIYDIAAMQALYGVNENYNAGNDLYAFDGTQTTQTLWDANGADIISAENYAGSDGVVIDLNEGLDHYSTIGEAYVWAAFGANIESAVGSSGADTLFGSALGNILTGGLGTDVIVAGSGNDTMYGGVGGFDPNDAADTLYGDGGNDNIFGNAGNDTIFGGIGFVDTTDGNDFIYGGKGADEIYGNAGADTIYGGGNGFDPNDEADVIYGGKGSDLIYGNGNNDIIYGGGNGFDPNDEADVIYDGGGNDLVYGNGGNDTIIAHAGDDSLHGGAGDDNYTFDGFSSGDDNILFFEGAGVAGGDVLTIASGAFGAALSSSGDVLSRISYASGDAIIDFGVGGSITIEDIAVGQMSTDDIIVV